jgi:FkbM family methyltransferase
MPTEPKSEPFDIRVIRQIFRRWPFPRGRGLLLKILSPLLRKRHFIFEAADGVLVPSDLDDWITLHGFIEGYDSEFSPSWSLIRPGGTVFDVGANIGIWTIGAARRAGKVHAFEPLESNFVRLESNVELNRASNIVARNLAVSDRAGTLQFFPSPNTNSGVGLLAPKTWNVPTCEVEATTLDDYCEHNEIRSVDVLKIDVEGAELLVLKGATRLLNSASPPAIIFEMNHEMAARFNSSPATIGDLLSQFGYSISAHRSGCWQPISIAEFSGHEDLLAFPKHAMEILDSWKTNIETR